MNILNQNVLVLNQNFEPLSVCTAKRAVVMAYMGKVDIIEMTLDRTIENLNECEVFGY